MNKNKLQLSWNQCDHYARSVLARVYEHYGRPDYIMTLPRGGLFIAQIASYYFDVPVMMTRQVLVDSRPGKVLFVDDIYDSGKTIQTQYGELPALCPSHDFFFAVVVSKQPDQNLCLAGVDIETNEYIYFPWED